jgi:hypothetical protein
MTHFNICILWLSTVCLVGTSGDLLAQDTTRVHAETSSEVPELTEFHEVIYKIWHTAWPEKDIAMLKELKPEVIQRGGSLCSAKLPGILREKQSAWESNVSKLKALIGEYGDATDRNDGAGLLDAAERLHAHYEVMVRLIRPALKELDEFHAALYPLYHYYLPQKNLKDIKSSVALLKKKMALLNEAVLPVKHRSKLEQFNTARADLGESLKVVDSTMSSNDLKEIEKAVETLHSCYQRVAGVFE